LGFPRCPDWVPVYHPRVTEPGDYIRVLGGVGVFQWNPARGGDETLGLLGNVGDLLGPLVIERMLWRRKSLQPSLKGSGSRLFSIGSVLHLARGGDVVWGSGVNGKALPAPLTRWPELDIRAVRGPWTARLLSHAGLRVPRVYGDPALLVGRLFPEVGAWVRSKSHDTLVVPNFNDMTMYEDADYEVLAPTESLWTVLRAVAKSRFVVGSSLHAVAVADALGVPARFVDSEHEDPFKYRDYLAGTGRPTTRIARSVGQALDLGPHRPPDVDLDALERAFPWDLWGVEGVGEGESEAHVEFVSDAMQSAWLERMAGGGGARNAVRRFVDELVSQIRQSATDGSPDLESLVSFACDYRRVVAPEAAMEPMDVSTQRLVDAIETQDVGQVRVAALLDASPALAMLRRTRPAGGFAVVSVVLHEPRTLAAASSLDLVLTGCSTGRVVRAPVDVFSIQRGQWHVDFDVMVDLELLNGDDMWTLAVEVDGPDPVSYEVVSTPRSALDLLALERGDLPVSAPAAVLASSGAEGSSSVHGAGAS
jgi:Polysaccharide pyruvyl transferase